MSTGEGRTVAVVGAGTVRWMFMAIQMPAAIAVPSTTAIKRLRSFILDRFLGG